jgi:hypothetical protein
MCGGTESVADGVGESVGVAQAVGVGVGDPHGVEGAGTGVNRPAGVARRNASGSASRVADVAWL